MTNKFKRIEIILDNSERNIKIFSKSSKSIFFSIAGTYGNTNVNITHRYWMLEKQRPAAVK